MKNLTALNAPIVSERELLDAVARERKAGKRIAFANGVFDVLHVGHVRYLQGAAAVADVLVVAVNGDDSVRMLKGEGRPLTSEDERAEIVAAIRGVAYVTIFHEKSPARLLAGAEARLSVQRDRLHARLGARGGGRALVRRQGRDRRRPEGSLDDGDSEG